MRESRIVEQVTGQSFQRFLEHHIFQPLGMKNTGMDNHRIIVKDRACGYEMWGSVVNAEYIDMSVPSGAGAMYSTVEDLFLWHQGLHQGRLLNKNSYSMMTTPHIDQFGYGLFLCDDTIRDESRKVIGHGGGINGFRSEYRHYTKEDVTVIVLSNQVMNQVELIVKELARLVMDDPVPLPEIHKPISLDPGESEHLVGDYKLHEDENSVISVTSDIGRLYIRQARSFKFEICPYARQEDGCSCFIKGMRGNVVFSGTEISVDAFGRVWKGHGLNQ